MQVLSSASTSQGLGKYPQASQVPPDIARVDLSVPLSGAPFPELDKGNKTVRPVGVPVLGRHGTQHQMYPMPLTLLSHSQRRDSDQLQFIEQWVETQEEEVFNGLEGRERSCLLFNLSTFTSEVLCPCHTTKRVLNRRTEEVPSTGESLPSQVLLH